MDQPLRNVVTRHVRIDGQRRLGLTFGLIEVVALVPDARERMVRERFVGSVAHGLLCALCRLGELFLLQQAQRQKSQRSRVVGVRDERLTDLLLGQLIAALFVDHVRATEVRRHFTTL